MRLINATTLEVHEFLNETQIPPFAILSHTWEAEECTFQQMQDPAVLKVSKRLGYKKIELCCKQARKDGYQWTWVDTYAFCSLVHLPLAKVHKQLLHRQDKYSRAFGSHQFDVSMVSRSPSVLCLPYGCYYSRSTSSCSMVYPRLDVRA